LILAYKTYILPIFYYCSPIWSPNTIGDIKRIEFVQRMFTKKLLSFSNLSYSDGLLKSGLITLELWLKSNQTTCTLSMYMYMLKSMYMYICHISVSYTSIFYQCHIPLVFCKTLENCWDIRTICILYRSI